MQSSKQYFHFTSGYKYNSDNGWNTCIHTHITIIKLKLYGLNVEFSDCVISSIVNVTFMYVFVLCFDFLFCHLEHQQQKQNQNKNDNKTKCIFNLFGFNLCMTCFYLYTMNFQSRKKASSTTLLCV